MRTLFVTLSVATLVGCGDPAQPAVDHLKTGLAAKQAAAEVGDSWSSDQKLQTFRVKQGRDPQSLEELEAAEGKLKTPPGKHWVYDAGGGKLSLADD